LVSRVGIQVAAKVQPKYQNQLPWCRSFSELDAVTRDYYRRLLCDPLTTPQWVG